VNDSRLKKADEPVSINATGKLRDMW
jgi:hypothetical protein